MLSSTRISARTDGRRTHATRLVVGVFVLSTFSSLINAGVVEAQPSWLSDRDAGPGFRAGRLELHPSFAAELGYDSNVFLEDQGTNGAAILRLTAGLAVTTLGGERRAEAEAAPPANVEFSGALHLSYLHYFATTTRDNLAGDLTFRLAIKPQGRFGFTLTETLARTVRPFVDATPTGSPSYGQNSSTTNATFHLQSPGGALRGTLGYQLGATFFDSGLFRGNNSLTHGLVSNMNWSFFPRTALFWEFSSLFLRYGRSDEAYQLLTDATTVRTSIGVNGVLSSKVSARLAIGYVAAIYAGDVTDDYDGVTARAELRLRPRDTISLNFGYAHDLAQSFIGGFVRQENIYAQLQMMFAAKVLVGLQLTGSYNRSGAALQEDGVTLLGNTLRRKDFRTMAQLYGEYRVLTWLALLAHVEYQADLTDYQFALPVGMPGVVIPDPGAGYQRVEAWLGARVSY